MSALTVMLHPRLVRFHRSVRAADGSIDHTLEFIPDTPVELTSDDDLQAIANDIGMALVQVAVESHTPKGPDERAVNKIRILWDDTRIEEMQVAIAKREENEKVDAHNASQSDPKNRKRRFALTNRQEQLLRDFDNAANQQVEAVEEAPAPTPEFEEAPPPAPEVVDVQPAEEAKPAAKRRSRKKKAAAK